MDTTIRTNSGAPLITPWSARGMSNDKFAALAAADTRKREVDSSAQKAFDTPTMKAADKDKDYVRQRIEGIKQRIKILQKMYSGNPKQMAHALAQVFKELRAAIKDYKAAIDKEFGASRGAVDATLTAGMPAEPAATPQSDAKGDDAPKDDASAETTQGDAPIDPEAKAPDVKEPDIKDPEVKDTGASQAQAADRTALYSSVEQKVREMAGNDGLDFIKEIKGLAQWIEDKLLAPARMQKMAQKPDKYTDNAFEDVEKTLKDLRKDMEDMERDIKLVAPGVGQRLDVAA